MIIDDMDAFPVAIGSHLGETAMVSVGEHERQSDLLAGDVDRSVTGMQRNGAYAVKTKKEHMFSKTSQGVTHG